MSLFGQDYCLVGGGGRNSFLKRAKSSSRRKEWDIAFASSILNNGDTKYNHNCRSHRSLLVYWALSNPLEKADGLLRGNCLVHNAYPRIVR